MSRTHWWFTTDSIYSVYAKVDIVAINRIKDGDNKPPPSNSPKIICPFSRYQVAASSCHRMEGKENRCQSCTSSTLPQWLFVGVALLPPGQPPAAHSVVSRGSPTVRPSHKAALSFAPHWHALIVMCIGEWLCSSTTFKGNEVPVGWPKCGFLDTVFIYFFFFRRKCLDVWVCFSKRVRQNSYTSNCQLSWRHSFVLF